MKCLNYGMNISFHQANLEIVLAQEENQIVCISYPHLYSTDDYKVPIDPCEADEFVDDSAMSVQDFSDDFAEFASIVMDELQLQKPNNAREGLNLYIHLIKEAEKLEFVLRTCMHDKTQSHYVNVSVKL